MSIDKKVKYDVQGGVKNYLGKQKEVKAPIKWQSSPDHPKTELAYITEAEKDLLVKRDLHGSLKGGVNRGPSGIMSLNGWGSKDAAGNEVGMSGTATSAAEAGGGSGADRRELESYISRDQMTTTQLPPGVEKQLPQDIKDYRNAFIAAGGGQRVNPGFFDSKYTVSPQEIASAKEYMNRTQFNPQTGRNERVNPYAKKSFRKTHGGGGLMGLIKSGGIFGNLIRGIGRAFGLGKNYNEPTYDMSEFNQYGLGGSQTPTYYNDLDNELMLSTEATPPTLDLSKLETGDLNNLASLIEASEQPQGIVFNNPVGGVDQYAKEMEALESMISPPLPEYGLPGLSYDIPINEMGGTLQQYYTQNPPDKKYLTKDGNMQIYNDGINFNDGSSQDIIGIDRDGVPTDEEIAILRGY